LKNTALIPKAARPKKVASVIGNNKLGPETVVEQTSYRHINIADTAHTHTGL